MPAWRTGVLSELRLGVASYSQSLTWANSPGVISSMLPWWLRFFVKGFDSHWIPFLAHLHLATSDDLPPPFAVMRAAIRSVCPRAKLSGAEMEQKAEWSTMLCCNRSFCMARPDGIEPTTYGLEACRRAVHAQRAAKS